VRLIADKEEQRFCTATELACAIYRPGAGEDGCTRSQRVTVIRAMHSLLRKHPDRIALAGGRGRTPLQIRHVADDGSSHRGFDASALIG